MPSGTVVAGTPQTREIAGDAKDVSVVVAASGGTIDVTYRIEDDGSAIDVPWSVGQVADAAIGSTVIDAAIKSFTVTGDGTFNWSVRY